MWSSLFFFSYFLKFLLFYTLFKVVSHQAGTGEDYVVAMIWEFSKLEIFFIGITSL